MSCNMFLRIKDEVEAFDPYFIQRRDIYGVLGLSSFQKVATVIRMLSYRVPGDVVDEYIRIGESFKRFVIAIIVVFGDQYLRSPNT